jgi:hypothetical protein
MEVTDPLLLPVALELLVPLVFFLRSCLSETDVLREAYDEVIAELALVAAPLGGFLRTSALTGGS